MNDLSELYRGSKTFKDYSKNYLDFLKKIFSDINHDNIERIVNIFMKARDVSLAILQDIKDARVFMNFYRSQKKFVTLLLKEPPRQKLKTKLLR